MSYSAWCGQNPRPFISKWLGFTPKRLQLCLSHLGLWLYGLAEGTSDVFCITDNMLNSQVPALMKSGQIVGFLRINWLWKGMHVHAFVSVWKHACVCQGIQKRSLSVPSGHHLKMSITLYAKATPTSPRALAPPLKPVALPLCPWNQGAGALKAYLPNKKWRHISLILLLFDSTKHYIHKKKPYHITNEHHVCVWDEVRCCAVLGFGVFHLSSTKEYIFRSHLIQYRERQSHFIGELSFSNA